MARGRPKSTPETRTAAAEDRELHRLAARLCEDQRDPVRILAAALAKDHAALITEIHTHRVYASGTATVRPRPRRRGRRQEPHEEALAEYGRLRREKQMSAKDAELAIATRFGALADASSQARAHNYLRALRKRRDRRTTPK